jgi:tetratricopeptide (TPR) repeat protein
MLNKEATMQTDRILAKLDSYLNKNDYASAERHLLYWLGEAQTVGDFKTALLVSNELMGLYRKQGMEKEAIERAEASVKLIYDKGLDAQVGAATTFLNCATVYKAFGRPDDALPLFEKARGIYEEKLDPFDSRMGGLYNNMGLALTDLCRFNEAKELYFKAIEIMKHNGSDLEVAITVLNLATLSENELGLEESCDTVDSYLAQAEEILENWTKRDGYYAFVCEKCASVFGYYGHFAYEKELYERSRRIYEGS